MANEFSIKVEFNELAFLAKRGLVDGGRVQQVIDSEVLRLCDPLIPLDTGALRDSGQKTTIGSGIVKYSTPYARKQYYIPMSHSGGRTSYWFEHMKQNGGKEKILNAAKKEAYK